MSSPLASPWRIASVAVVLGLLGSCAVVLALTDSSGPSALTRRTGSAAARRAGHSLRPGRPVAAPDPARARAGLQLMGEAAAASGAVAYSGVQLVAWWGRGGASASVVQVWHRPGSGTVARPLIPRRCRPRSSSPGCPGAGPGRDPGHVEPLVALMQVNYQIVYVGPGSADNRPAQVVELWRPDGSVAAQVLA